MRDDTMRWLQDVLEHFELYSEHWQDADPATERFLQASLQRDLRRLTQALEEERAESHNRGYGVNRCAASF